MANRGKRTAAKTRERPSDAVIKPDNQECWRTTTEHGVLPPASLQSNDPLQLFFQTHLVKEIGFCHQDNMKRRGALMINEGEFRRRRRKITRRTWSKPHQAPIIKRSAGFVWMKRRFRCHNFSFFFLCLVLDSNDEVQR